MQAPDLVYICDWLPPDFGAVGQYSLMFATELAEQGQHVALVGLSSSGAQHETKSVGRGRLSIHKLDAQPYSKTRRGERLLWTLKTNTRLLRAAWPLIAAAKTVLFTGSPPMFLHWIAPANVVLRRKLVYRITDFHPECAIAELSHPPVWLRLAYWATLFWRRRVDEFEVLGHDQAQLLRDIGIADDRIRFKPDPSPVTITADTQPLPRPPGFEGKQLLLYSGNWGIAHNVQTFLDGYAAHHRQGTGRVVLWLNAVGSGADTVEETLRRYGLPFHHSQLVPIDAARCAAGHARRTPDHAVRCIRRLRRAVEGARLHRLAQTGRIHRQREVRRAPPVLGERMRLHAGRGRRRSAICAHPGASRRSVRGRFRRHAASA